jgi:outer membrane receptor for ferric coprogen and ferric-rhodotorulic acid
LTLLLHRDNKSQQESTTHGGEEFGRGNKDQQKSTQFNRVKQKSANIVQNHQKSSQIITRPERSHQKSSIVIRNHRKSAKVSTVALVRKPLTVFLGPNSGYWNIKECVTGGPGTSYKFLLQTDL